MPDEGSFLQAILTNPTDDLPRLVYADWLDEQQTDEASRKAEFLRLTAALVMETNTATRLKLEQQVMQLARHLPTDWLPVVSRLVVENCHNIGDTVYRPLHQIEFEFECPIRWEQLTPTEVAGVRDCKACQQKVYYCSTIGEARDHARQGNCIAVDVALPRAEGDLRELQLWKLRSVGRPSPAEVKREREERERGELAEEVSEEREQRHQEIEASQQQLRQSAQHERLRQLLRRRQ